ncbi:hypothetical protein CAOG_04815 [Capsaspora owczarzaki ATCC 30864]|uniref:PI-PLC Y-box domain-containing protein n=1 Tax=Capsaspora owczarzaki (strain ATCC 30864) TaxID=595528 RepID=A0A0D2WS16_CAPO3|nr:hypothetical protein CAOG_04815 [Capsaspora owczarzaki ATCC 30864]KJE94128.1 hypothetical protein CAOG_004815 [Capsaspora owczarzaki ATCC 30864]|eukprot:XP_004347566.1 hypothetical protein CAOG_04815 [Capsaspora owczarzaki ATCC 30864]
MKPIKFPKFKLPWRSTTAHPTASNLAAPAIAPSSSSVASVPGHFDSLSPPLMSTTSLPVANKEARRNAERGLYVARTFPQCTSSPCAAFCTTQQVRQQRPGFLYETPAHNDILDYLTNLTNFLSAGKYEGRNGAATRTLVGAKGIGKTATCMTFIKAAASLWPNVIPVYLNYTGIQAQTHPLVDEHGGLNSVLRALKVPDDANFQVGQGQPAHAALLNFLDAHGLRMLLIVDELDEGYRFATRDSFAATLAGFQVFGNSTEGLVAVVLCGSSATLPSLICGDQETEFPLSFQGMPNLNDTKFSVQRVYTPTPVDIDVVGMLLRQPKPTNDILARHRHILYMVGANAREIGKVDTGTATPPNDLSSSEVNTNYMNHFAARHLHLAMLDLLIHDNKSILLRMYPEDATTDDAEYIQQNAWHSEFKPLEQADVDDLWKTLQDGGKVDRKDKSRLNETLHYLLDRGYIAMARSSTSNSYFPYSLFNLVARMLEKRDTKHRKQILRTVLPVAVSLMQTAATAAVALA